jgi:hypothetical protein
MVPGSWSVGRLMGGFCVKTDKQAILAEMRGSQLPFAEHRRNAELIARLPDLVDMVRQAENYFGDLPSSDKAALRMHGKITRMLNSIGIDPTADDQAA